MGDAGACQTSNKKDYDDQEDEAPPAALDEGDIALLKTYGLGPYTTSIKNIEKEITDAKVFCVLCNRYTPSCLCLLRELRQLYGRKPCGIRSSLWMRGCENVSHDRVSSGGVVFIVPSVMVYSVP